MGNTRQTIEKILSEIEADGTLIYQGHGKSTEEVINILLDRKDVDSIQSCSEISGHSVFDMNELKIWKEKNNQLYCVDVNHPICSNRPGIGKGIVLLKKVIRKMIRFILFGIVNDQNQFNASVTASINALYNNEIVTNAFIQQQNQFNEQCKRYQQEILDLNQKLAELNIKVQEIENPGIYDAIDYKTFEAAFRGSEDQIYNIHKEYLEYYKDKSNVIDLGCGRGEFLEILTQNHISCKGVDLYTPFVDECQEKGLDVIEKDALEFLSEQPDDSVGGIFASQIAEHLKPKELIRLCFTAYQKLEENGCFILETPNPTCLSTYTNAFYMDLSHIKPVHPKTLEFILKQAGFTSVDIVFTEQSKIGYRLPLLNSSGAYNLEEFNDGINMLSDVIFGSQDYAIIAKK